MKHFITLVAVASLTAWLTGCATAYQINRVQVGMTKDEVIRTVGHPVSISAQGETEYLNYRFSETDDNAFYGITTPYYVRLVNGKVDSYGRLGDFDSTQKPTIQIKREDIIDADVRTSAKPDLYTEIQKLKSLKDDGTITDKEYEALKKRLIEGK